MDFCTKSGSQEDIALGRALIASGKVGCIVLAGGDGSRLGWDGPKGTFPLSLVKQKSLFQLLDEKVAAASNHYEQKLKLAVMTSPLNDAITKKAFKNPVDFFTQRLVPLLDMDEKPMEEKRPNGNGEVLKQFYLSGIYDKWKKAGIELVQVILIDNPLAEPFDPNQIGVHFKKNADISLKAILRENPSENVGVIGKKEGKLTIVEYSENPPADWNLANTSLFCFSMHFIEKVKDIELPLHKVKKFVDTKPVYKRETFIFDLLPHANSAEVILYPRSEIFAPLKNRDDVGPVQRALLEKDRAAFKALSGTPPHEQIFELHPAFHYPTETMRERWKERAFPGESYLDS